MKSKILVLGSDGQLGKEIQDIQSEYENFNFIFSDINDFNLGETSKIFDFLSNISPEYIINCAAYTAVDKAETEEDLAYKINCDAVREIVKYCEGNNTKLIHISTDYVFNGNNWIPYKEDDPVFPTSAYGRTKLAGEIHVLASKIDAIIIRTSWLYSSHGNNFVKTMLRLGAEKDELGVIFDQIGTPTYAGDLAKAIMKIILQNINNNEFNKGIYHFSNEGVCSWYDFALAVFKISKINCKVNPIETHDYPLPAKRPPYSVFNKNKIKQTFNITIPHWEDSLKAMLQNKKSSF
jgi:dTDP-4-dehydrorhamnose reductase